MEETELGELDVGDRRKGLSKKLWISSELNFIEVNILRLSPVTIPGPLIKR